jgi:hypothetical protein
VVADGPCSEPQALIKQQNNSAMTPVWDDRAFIEILALAIEHSRHCISALCAAAEIRIGRVFTLSSGLFVCLEIQ